MKSEYPFEAGEHFKTKFMTSFFILLVEVARPYLQCIIFLMVIKIVIINLNCSL